MKNILYTVKYYTISALSINFFLKKIIKHLYKKKSDVLLYKWYIESLSKSILICHNT